MQQKSEAVQGANELSGLVANELSGFIGRMEATPYLPAAVPAGRHGGRQESRRLIQS